MKSCIYKKERNRGKKGVKTKKCSGKSVRYTIGQRI
jgi:hypothetical protein